VLPGALHSTAFRIAEGDRFEPTASDSEGGGLVFAGYDDQGRLVGLAIEAQGMGYQDVIRLLYGYALDQEAIIRIRVLDTRETPGLGDRIETDPDFLRNFERLDVSLDDSRAALRHPIEMVKPGEKESPWQIDGITGATISSRAVAQMLRQSSAWWIPRVARNREDFRRKE
jgi:electron transport complex protein RnfG